MVSVSLIANKVKIFVFALWKDGVVTVFRVCWKEEKSQMVMCTVISTKRSIASKRSIVLLFLQSIQCLEQIA